MIKRIMTGIGRKLFLMLAMLVAMEAARGQCDPLPLPYITDFIEGFQPPPNFQESFGYNWTEGLNADNCWIGYLDFGGDQSYARSSLHRNSARGRFGFNRYDADSVAWPQVAEIAVKDSTHHGVAMLIAPRFSSTPASFRLTIKLQRYIGSGYTGDEIFWGNVDIGWVTDVSRPEESFHPTGTMAIHSHHLLDTSYVEYCLPVYGEAPAGGRFAMRMRSKAQGPARNLCPPTHFYYELMFRQFVADSAVCPPPIEADTVMVSDSICQYSSYHLNGISLSAAQTADTGTRTFVLHDFEYFTPDSCFHHVKVLSLTVLPSDISIAVDSIFPGEAYLFAGRELTLAGGYVDDHGLNSHGCPIKDSLELSIRPLPPIECDAEIGVERLEWYISQPTEVSLWSVSEADSYRWSPATLFADDTARNVSFLLHPESQQWVRLETERTDTVNHIYHGAEMDTTTLQLQLTAPVEPQTRYRFAIILGDGGDVTAQVIVGGESMFSGVAPAGRLEVEFGSSQCSEVTITVMTNQSVRMTSAGLWRYCRAVDLVTIVAHSLCPVIMADRTVICLGDSVTLRARQTDYYRWASWPTDASLEEQQGRASVTVSPQVTTTYYLLTPDSTVADSVVIVLEDNPVLQFVADREVVDFDHPVLTLEELSAVANVRWTFSDGGEAEGQKVQWRFGEVTGDSLWVREVGCTANGCCSDTLLMFPVETVSVWFPNVFTPGEATNSSFAMVTNQTVEAYELTIYNREGLMVARCTDVAVGWNGIDFHGKACPQGVYAYVCEYRLAGKPAKRYMGTVLLLR